MSPLPLSDAAAHVVIMPESASTTTSPRTTGATPLWRHIRPVRPLMYSGALTTTAITAECLATESVKTKSL